MQVMKDPAAGVSPQLLPHMHLVSKHRYPNVSNLSLETVVGYLIEAPKIVRDLYQVQWQFLDPPPTDGTLMLVWQPLEYLGTNFASDGYIWGDAEVAFKSDVRGYTLEMFLHRSGYVAPNEPIASHCRRRYRLLPGNPALGLPHPDPSLWIVHYSKAASRDHISSASIPIQNHINLMIQQRRIIQSQGLLARKDFMLHDRANWPTINAPPAITGRGSSGQIIPGAHRRMGSVNLVPGEASLEEEEDVSRGDMLDFLTPRDISRMRYEQHHEWMEEILDSPYSTLQIIPTDLGLGRKGELEALTGGFFHAPTTQFPETAANATISKMGKMDPEKAKAFTNKASHKISEMESELEAMKRKHAKRMEKLKKTASLGAAERRLRAAANGKDERDQRSSMPGRVPQTADDIIREVEDTWGKKVERVTSVTLIEKGGLEERPASNGIFAAGGGRSGTEPFQGIFPFSNLPSTNPQPATGQYSTEQPPTQEEPQQPREPSQAPTQSVRSPTSVPPEQSVGQDQSTQSSSTRVSSLDQTNLLPPSVNEEEDVEMGEPEDEEGQVPEREVEQGEWVMVDNEGSDDSKTQTALSAEQPGPPPPPQGDQAALNPSSGEMVPTPGSGQQEDTQASISEPQTEAIEEADDLDGGEFDITGEFDNVDVDTAGDALADYGADDEDLNLDTMDDSAFGEAFHPPDESTPRDENEIS